MIKYVGTKVNTDETKFGVEESYYDNRRGQTYTQISKCVEIVFVHTSLSSILYVYLCILKLICTHDNIDDS